MEAKVCVSCGMSYHGSECKACASDVMDEEKEWDCRECASRCSLCGEMEGECMC